MCSLKWNSSIGSPMWSGHEPDYFDRYICGEAHYHADLRSIEDNPVKAGLCTRSQDWPFGSVVLRADGPPSQ